MIMYGMGGILRIDNEYELIKYTYVFNLYATDRINKRDAGK